MYSYHFREWLSFFYFYCMIGWCFESTYVSLKNRRFVNRGFLDGPWLPIYGTGAILVLWLTLPFQQNPVLVFIVGAIGATVLEFFTGEAMVRIFHVRYWDYSDQRFQYKGHICLTSTIAWGFLSLLMVYVIHKPVEQFIFWVHEEVASVLTYLITALMVYDFANAFREAMDLRDMLLQAELLWDEMEERMESLELSLDEKIRQLEERQEQLKERMMKRAERLLLQNPGGKFVSLKVDSAEIRERIQAIKEKIKTEHHLQ